MADKKGKTDPLDKLAMENICALHLTPYTENTAKFALKVLVVKKATPSLVDVPGASFLALTSNVE